MRVGVIGLQHKHIETLAHYVLAREEHTLVGWVESDPRLREDISARFGVRVFESAEELYGTGVDVVGVATVNRERGRVLIEALERGVHVIADKPMALSLEELERARAIQEANGLQASVLFTERFNPPVVRLHEAVNAGELGELVSFTAFRPHKLRLPTRPAWMFDHHLYGGLLADLGSHDIDVLRWISGREPEVVDAWQGNYANEQFDDFFDAAHATFRLEGGAMASVSANWLTPSESPYHGDCRYFVQGTRGSAEVLTCRGYGEDTIILNTDRHQMTRLEVGEADNTRFFDSFFSAVAGAGPALVPSREAFLSTELSLRAQLAADAAVTSTFGGAGPSTGRSREQGVSG